MKEKRQLKPLLVRSPAHLWHPVANLYTLNVYRTANSRMWSLCLYLDPLEEELPTLLTSSSGRQSARPALELEVEEREVSQPGLTGVGSQGFVVRQLPIPLQ
jgi:hypothetical protein